MLRVYEHDQSLRQKEIDLIRLVSGPVPVADVIHAERIDRTDLRDRREPRPTTAVTS